MIRVLFFMFLIAAPLLLSAQQRPAGGVAC